MVEVPDRLSGQEYTCPARKSAVAIPPASITALICLVVAAFVVGCSGCGSPPPAVDTPDAKVQPIGVHRRTGNNLAFDNQNSVSTTQPNRTFIVVHVKVTPKQATERPEKPEGLPAMVTKYGTWPKGSYMFETPFAMIRPDGEDKWSFCAGVIQDQCDLVVPADNESISWFSAPAVYDGLSQITFLAPGHSSVMALVFSVPDSAKNATLRFHGAVEVPISLDNWGKQPSP